MLRRALLTCLWSLTVAGVANAQTPYSVFKERKNDQKTLEIVAVLPIAAKTGVLSNSFVGMFSRSEWA